MNGKRIKQAQIPICLRRLSLRTLLVVPFVLQIFAAVGLTGYLSLLNGQKAVHELADRLQREAFARVDQHLDAYLATPRQITQLNLDAIEQELIDLKDLDRSGRYFWKQSQVFPQLSFVGYYLVDKTGVGAGRWLQRHHIFIGLHPLEINQAKSQQASRTVQWSVQ